MRTQNPSLIVTKHADDGSCGGGGGFRTVRPQKTAPNTRWSPTAQKWRHEHRNTCSFCHVTRTTTKKKIPEGSRERQLKYFMQHKNKLLFFVVHLLVK